MSIVNIAQAAGQLQKLVDEASEDSEVVISSPSGKFAKLVPCNSPESSPCKKRVPGSMAGQIAIYGDFNDLDQEIAESFYASEIFPTDDRG
ncbi:hypothetical protein BH09SUM1_BH09SUM1_26930 [soil metagenome]